MSRTAAGGRVDRSRPLRFTFDGKSYEGFAGDTLASGLLAGKYTPTTTFGPNDHRTINRNGEKFNVGETFAGFGFEKGLGRRAGEAPVFVGVVTALVIIGAVVAMIPGIPVFHLLVGVQAVNGILLPITLYFVWRLSASAELMGKYRNGRIFNVVAGATVHGIHPSLPLAYQTSNFGRGSEPA